MGVFTNFCCRSGGSNLNAGSRTGDTTEPGTAASFTYASGNWVAATGVFTPASGDPQADGVAVGDFASVYADGSSVTGFVGRVTARNTTTITVSLTIRCGTTPSDGTANRTLKIGGAWAGPSGTSGFPINISTNGIGSLYSLNGDLSVRLNLKNDQTHNITAVMLQTGQFHIRGYTSTYGDGGRAEINGGSSGSAYILLRYSGAGTTFYDMIFSNNGATSEQVLVSAQSNAYAPIFFNCVFKNSRGNGLDAYQGAKILFCEFSGNNTSNTANNTALKFQAHGGYVHGCIFHDNTGSNTSGILINIGGVNDDLVVSNCIFDTNGKHGITFNGGVGLVVSGCDFYNNGGSGISLDGSSTRRDVAILNSTFCKNAAWGIISTSSVPNEFLIRNCGFGSGSAANTSGNISTTTQNSVSEAGTVTYPSGDLPWVDGANGDFRINHASAKNAGFGTFAQTSGGSGTVGYYDIGAAQHTSAGLSGGSRMVNVRGGADQ